MNESPLYFQSIHPVGVVLFRSSRLHRRRIHTHLQALGFMYMSALWWVLWVDFIVWPPTHAEAVELQDWLRGLGVS
jgi:hypothetical protein